MGCVHSSNRNPHKAGQSSEAQNQVKVSPVNPQGNFQVAASDFVRSKNTKLKHEYNIESKFEKGSQGKVKKAIHKATGATRAVKIVRKKDLTSAEKERFISEMIIMSKLDHPNIARVYEVFETKNKFCIVTEYCEGDDVFEKVIDISNFSEKEAAKIMKQVLSAVLYCHQNNVVHRDVKPENLVYETKSKDSNIKLVDFDCARSFDGKKNLTELHGTPYYIAPEVLKKNYDEKCDIWSCGVVLYILLSGIPPFSGETNAEIFDKISIGNYHFNYKVWDTVSEEAKNFIKKMFEHDPKKRLSAEQALQDPWLVAATQDQEGKFDHPIATENLQSLQSFGFKTKFQEATWAFLVSNYATKSEKQKLLQTFKALDQNGDGQLTKEDLKKGFVKIMKMSEEEAQAEADRIISGLDANASGKIDYSEFVNATISKKQMLKKSKLEAAFKQFDKNGDGKISGDEIKFMFNQGKVSEMPEETWNEWIAQVDKNGDGTISLEEFKEMMMSLVPKSRAVL